MTKIDVTDGKVSVVSVGDVREIAADLCSAIASISEHIHEGSEDAGNLFELLMIAGLVTCFGEMEERKAKGGDE